MVRRDAASGQALPPYFAGEDCHSVVWSPDGKTLIAGLETRRCLLRPGTGETIELPHGPSSQAGTGTMAFSPDGTCVTTPGIAGVINLSETATGRLRSVWVGHPPAVNSTAFSPDGRIVASGGADGAVKLWDVATGREMFTLRVTDDGDVNEVAFSPDGEFLAATYTSRRGSGGVALWRATPP